MKSYDSETCGQYVVKALFNARKYAYICSPYIDEKYANAILDLAERKVFVKVISSSSEMFYFFRDHGSKTLRYNITHDNSPIVHTKMYIADDCFGAEGSANLTYNGMWQQMNSLSYCERRDEVESLKKRFEKLWETVA